MAFATGRIHSFPDRQIQAAAAADIFNRLLIHRCILLTKVKNGKPQTNGFARLCQSL
jgi:hypothetical protein